MSGMSSPRGLCTAPDLSDTATMIAPSLAIRSAATEPTFPNPCTATRAPLRLIPSLANASRVTNMHPRPVASRRPSEPPISTGFPVTTARSEEHTSELQSRVDLVCRLLLEKKKQKKQHTSSVNTNINKRTDSKNDNT